MKRVALGIVLLAIAGILAHGDEAVDRTLKYDFLIGAEQHDAWDEGNVDETLSLMKQAGFNSWRSDLRALADMEAREDICAAGHDLEGIQSLCRLGLSSHSLPSRNG